MKIEKSADEKLGMVVKGGIQGQPGNPLDSSDEGVFISKINDGGCASLHSPDDLKVGQRIIEVNGQSLLGATHAEAVTALRNAGNSIQVGISNQYRRCLGAFINANPVIRVPCHLG